MIIRSKAPLRLGLAGGGTDVSPYCDIFGGCVLNTTINLYTYCTITPKDNGTVRFVATDRDEIETMHSTSILPLNGILDLHKGVYNRIVKNYNLSPLSFEMTTYSDAPAGSGLGTSSTLVVCILQAFIEWLNLPLGEYDVAQLAYQIEREDLMLSGGKQDQYAATFGGFNFIEFEKDNRVIVNPLRIKDKIVFELELSTLLYFTGISRSSAKIIEDQKKSLEDEHRLKSMHQIKDDAFVIKESLLKGNFNKFFETMKDAWTAKKGTSESMTTPYINEIYETALSAGAYCGKISGAGGGGFMFLFLDPSKRQQVKNALKKFNGGFVDFNFVKQGAYSWKINQENNGIL